MLAQVVIAQDSQQVSRNLCVKLRRIISVVDNKDPLDRARFEALDDLWRKIHNYHICRTKRFTRLGRIRPDLDSVFKDQS